jgi:hypothetical protein
VRWLGDVVVWEVRSEFLGVAPLLRWLLYLSCSAICSRIAVPGCDHLGASTSRR